MRPCPGFVPMRVPIVQRKKQSWRLPTFVRGEVKRGAQMCRKVALLSNGELKRSGCRIFGTKGRSYANRLTVWRKEILRANGPFLYESLSYPLILLQTVVPLGNILRLLVSFLHLPACTFCPAGTLGA